MRHRNSGRQLSRNASHRHAMLRNMATSLLQHETIRTTVPKAKELRRVVEPLITLAKVDSIAMRRLAYARLRDIGVVDKLFADLAFQGAGGRLHANSEDGTASRRFGRYGPHAAGRSRRRGHREERRSEGRQGAQGFSQEIQKGRAGRRRDGGSREAETPQESRRLKKTAA